MHKYAQQQEYVCSTMDMLITITTTITIIIILPYQPHIPLPSQPLPSLKTEPILIHIYPALFASLS